MNFTFNLPFGDEQNFWKELMEASVYLSPEDLQDLEETKLQVWREIQKPIRMYRNLEQLLSRMNQRQGMSPWLSAFPKTQSPSSNQTISRYELEFEKSLERAISSLGTMPDEKTM